MAPLEAHRAKAGADIVAPRAALREGFERETGRLDPIDIRAGDVVACFRGDGASLGHREPEVA